jgi:ADP-ribosylglycohydrolase
MQNTARKNSHKLHAQGSPSIFEVFQQAMLAAAIGDAFGLPMEFLCEQEITQAGFPQKNTRGQLPFLGKSSDDTQLNLFTGEGIIYFKCQNTHKFSDHQQMNDMLVIEIARAYQRWLNTQGEVGVFCEDIDTQTGLAAYPELHQRVDPGDTCISALKDMESPSESAYNFSKGSGVTIKNLPIAMAYAMESSLAPGLSCHQKGLASFELGFKVAQITHGHPIAKLTAAAIASLFFFNLQLGRRDNTLVYSMAMTRSLIMDDLGNIESLSVDIQSHHMELILKLLDNNYYRRAQSVSAYGQGWCADEALAIALHSVLYADTFEEVLVMSACHSGDSDTTCSLAASLFVSAKEDGGIPDYLLENLALKNIVQGITEKFMT